MICNKRAAPDFSSNTSTSNRLLQIFILSLWLTPNLAAAASQMYSVTNVSTMQVQAYLQDKSSDQVKLQVIDVVSGKRVWIRLNPTSQPGQFEGFYQIDIKGKSGQYPLLQFSYNKKILYIKHDPKSKRQEIQLYERERDVPAVDVTPEAVAPGGSKAPPASSGAESKPESLKVLDESEKKEQEQERLGLEAQEALRRAALLKQQEEMSAQAQQQRKEKAAKLADRASELYSQNQFDPASQLFAEAVELDPGNGLAYYQYGVSLYKTNQFNKSLAVLAMAEGGPQKAAEHNYYVALNHLKLQQPEKALDKFIYVRDENDPQISATASFLAGNIEFQAKKYDEAKKSFEYTLDYSKDPEMDRQSEDMIELIDQIEAFEASAKEKLSYSLNLGLGYDGNVLNIARQNVSTDVEAYRLSYGGSLIYKFFQTFKSEWSAIASVSDIYSVDQQMIANATLQAADPLVTSLSMPYRTQWSTKSRSYVINLTPSLSSLTMNVENDTRKPIMQSGNLSTDVSFPLNKDWSSTYKLDVNQDISFLSSAEADDQSGLRSTFVMTQTRLLDPKATRTLAGDLGYTLNNSRGLNNNYYKSVLGFTFSFPGPSKIATSVRAELASQKYTDNTNERLDSTYTLSISGTKSLQKQLTLSLSLQMAGNKSNVDANLYDKIVVATLLTYTGTLIKTAPKKKD